jgi:hypothetical protein
MKRLGKWLLVIAVVLTGVFLVLRTPCICGMKGPAVHR